MRKDKSTKLAYFLVVTFEVIIIITGISAFIMKEMSNFYLYLLAIICLFIPFLITYICNKKCIILPKHFQSISLIIIFLAQYFGEILNFYLIIWWWDLLIHILFGGYFVILSSYVVQSIVKKESRITESRFLILVLLFSFNFSLTLGTFWEVFEFVGDFLFKTNMVKGGLDDTMTDLISHIISAFIVSLLLYRKGRV